MGHVYYVITLVTLIFIIILVGVLITHIHIYMDYIHALIGFIDVVSCYDTSMHACQSRDNGPVINMHGSWPVAWIWVVVRGL